MPFTEDLAAMFDVDYGFAVLATSGAASFPVLFDNAYQGSLNGLVQDTNPIARARASDVAALVQGSPLTVAAVTYRIVSLQPDGTGVTVLELRRAA
jgi:hypothetical protein